MSLILAPIRWAVAGPARMVAEGLMKARQLIAFTLITFGALVTNFGRSSKVVRPLVREEIFRAGVRLVPLVCFLGITLGIGVVGQTEAILQQVGATQFTGALLATMVVREMAPLVAALVVLARVGTAAVIELGTARAAGEIEALEALGIDPIHYLVVPRVIGFTVAIVALAAYFAVLSLASGYAFAFTRGLPLTLSTYFGNVAGALRWFDFPLIALKTVLFGLLTGLVVCYQGLGRPLALEEIGGATTRSVAAVVVGCLCLDALFIPLYFLL